MSAAQADAFHREVLQHGVVFTVRDGDGFPAPQNSDGARFAPFWSLRSRVERVIENVPAFADFEIAELSLVTFRRSWLPGLERDGIMVGLNWSGKNAPGYDCTPAEVAATLDFRES